MFNLDVFWLKSLGYHYKSQER